MRGTGCGFFWYLNYSVYFHTLSFWSVPSSTSNTERQYTFNNRLVEKHNECFIYLKLTQFPNEMEGFVCFRINMVAPMELFIYGNSQIFVKHNVQGRFDICVQICIFFFFLSNVLTFFSVWSRAMHAWTGAGFNCFMLTFENFLHLPPLSLILLLASARLERQQYYC